MASAPPAGAAGGGARRRPAPPPLSVTSLSPQASGQGPAPSGKSLLSPLGLGRLLKPELLDWDGMPDVPEWKHPGAAQQQAPPQAGALARYSSWFGASAAALSRYQQQHAQPTQDMTLPLSAYFLSSGHNSYLHGDQLTSRSGTRVLRSCLQQGCRVVELDIWDGKDLVQGPIVTHGGTLTGRVSIKECVAVIKQYAFVASPYPVIITFENHCTPKFEKAVARTLLELLGGPADLLYVPYPWELGKWKSPEQLRHKRAEEACSEGERQATQTRPERTPPGVKDVLIRANLREDSAEEFRQLIYIPNRKFQGYEEASMAEDVASSSFSETAAADMIKKAVEASILTPAKLSNRLSLGATPTLAELESGARQLLNDTASQLRQASNDHTAVMAAGTQAVAGAVSGAVGIAAQAVGGAVHTVGGAVHTAAQAVNNVAGGGTGPMANAVRAAAGAAAALDRNVGRAVDTLRGSVVQAAGSPARALQRDPSSPPPPLPHASTIPAAAIDAEPQEKGGLGIGVASAPLPQAAPASSRQPSGGPASRAASSQLPQAASSQLPLATSSELTLRAESDPPGLDAAAAIQQPSFVPSAGSEPRRPPPPPQLLRRSRDGGLPSANGVAADPSKGLAARSEPPPPLGQASAQQPLATAAAAAASAPPLGGVPAVRARSGLPPTPPAVSAPGTAANTPRAGMASRTPSLQRSEALPHIGQASAHQVAVIASSGENGPTSAASASAAAGNGPFLLAPPIGQPPPPPSSLLLQGRSHDGLSQRQPSQQQGEPSVPIPGSAARSRGVSGDGTDRRTSLRPKDAQAAASQSLGALYAYTARHLVRIYPSGLRIDSSNYNPMEKGWCMGASIVALNWQARGKSMALNRAFFAQNAGLGYVKKPAWMLEHVGRSHAVPCSSIPLNPLPLRPTPWTLQLHLFSAFCHQSVVQACYCMRDDLFLQVKVTGMPQDQGQEFKTDVAHNSDRLYVDQLCEIKLFFPELAAIQVTLRSQDPHKANVRGRWVVAVPMLRVGQWRVHLTDGSGTPRPDRWVKLAVAWADGRDPFKEEPGEALYARHVPAAAAPAGPPPAPPAAGSAATSRSGVPSFIQQQQGSAGQLGGGSGASRGPSATAAGGAGGGGQGMSPAPSIAAEHRHMLGPALAALREAEQQ